MNDFILLASVSMIPIVNNKTRYKHANFIILILHFFFSSQWRFLIISPFLKLLFYVIFQ